MEQNPYITPDKTPDEADDPETRGRQWTAEQMSEFRKRVAKELQLAAQRSDPARQPSTTRRRQTKKQYYKAGPSAGRPGY